MGAEAVQFRTLITPSTIGVGDPIGCRLFSTSIVHALFPFHVLFSFPLLACDLKKTMALRSGLSGLILTLECHYLLALNIYFRVYPFTVARGTNRLISFSLLSFCFPFTLALTTCMHVIIPDLSHFQGQDSTHDWWLLNSFCWLD